MFCTHHAIPHEDCAACEPTLASMRPTVFAELAAAELRSGTDCCATCEYLYFGTPRACPRCNSPVNPASALPRAPARPPALGPLSPRQPSRIAGAALAARPAGGLARPGLSALHRVGETADA